MKHPKSLLFFTVIALLLLFEAKALMAQERYSVLVGTVLGIRARLWLDVQSEKDKVVVNFDEFVKTQKSEKMSC